MKSQVLVDDDVIEPLQLVPTEHQVAFITSPCRFTLFGGARGGGKTFAIIIDWTIHSAAYGRKARGIVFRRTQVELDDFIEEAKDVLEPAGHRWNENKKSFISPEGAVLRCRYLENDADAGKYQGHQYTRVYIEEIGNFPNEAPIKKLAATLRSKHGILCCLKATANPGGIGHAWVKARFIDHAPANTPFSLDSGKTYSVYIPAKLTDNPHLMENDPGYIDMIKQSGDAELVRAWLDGDWDVVVGQFFSDFRRDRHIIPTVAIPDSWTVRYRAMDWGSSKPYCALWFAVADGSELPGVEVHIPRGALVVYRELYGIAKDPATGLPIPNTGLRETSREVARKVLAAEQLDSHIIQANSALNKIDPSTFATNGGPSIAEEMARAGCWWLRADNRRVAGQGATGGWDQVRARMRGDKVPDAPDVPWNPMLFIMDCCTHTIRTVPMLPRDPLKLDDVDSDAEDHPADTLRYGCMARPYDPPSLPKSGPYAPVFPKVRSINQITMDEAWQCLETVPSGVIMRN